MKLMDPHDFRNTLVNEAYGRDEEIKRRTGPTKRKTQKMRKTKRKMSQKSRKGV